MDVTQDYGHASFFCAVCSRLMRQYLQEMFTVYTVCKYGQQRVGCCLSLLILAKINVNVWTSVMDECVVKRLCNTRSSLWSTLHWFPWRRASTFIGGCSFILCLPILHVSWLGNNLPGRWTGCGGPVTWASHFPVLSLPFFVGILKRKILFHGSLELESIINHIEVAGAAIRNQPSQLVIWGGGGSIQCCFEAYVHQDGGHLLWRLITLTSPHHMNSTVLYTVKWQLINAAGVLMCLIYLFNWKQGAQFCTLCCRENETFLTLAKKIACRNVWFLMYSVHYFCPVVSKLGIARWSDSSNIHPSFQPLIGHRQMGRHITSI
jgi:hypothetical protein